MHPWRVRQQLAVPPGSAESVTESPRIMGIGEYAITSPEAIDRFFNRDEAHVVNQGVRTAYWAWYWIVGSAVAWGVMFGIGWLAFHLWHRLTGGTI